MKRLRLRFGALIGLAALVLISCRDRGPVTPEIGIQAANISNRHGLLPCRPLAYDSVTARIGARGGSIRVSRHVLTIPPFALSRPVEITVVAPSDTVNRLEFRPEGLSFRFPASITMSYVNCSQTSQSKGIAYTSDSLVILEYVPADDDVNGNRVTGSLNHFSTYAVSW
jgi:hypothetical protein